MCVSPLLLLAIAVIWFASNSILINSKVQIPCSLPSLWWACQLDHSHKLCFHLQRGWCHWHRWSWNSFDRNLSKNWNLSNILKYFKRQKYLSKTLKYLDNFRADIVPTFPLLLTHKSPLSPSTWPKYIQLWSDTKYFDQNTSDQNIYNYDSTTNTHFCLNSKKFTCSGALWSTGYQAHWWEVRPSPAALRILWEFEWE